MAEEPKLVGQWKYCPACGGPIVVLAWSADTARQDADDFDHRDVYCAQCERPWIACPCDL